jgi:hypothetical protein
MMVGIQSIQFAMLACIRSFSMNESVCIYASITYVGMYASKQYDTAALLSCSVYDMLRCDLHLSAAHACTLQPLAYFLFYMQHLCTRHA